MFNLNKMKTTIFIRIIQSWNIRIVFILSLTAISNGCKKYVSVDTLKDQLLSSEVFENPASANAAIAGDYVQVKNSLMSAAIIYNSLCSDDIVNFTANSVFDNYKNNVIPSNDASLPWSNLYAAIYAANSTIEGLINSKGIKSETRDNYIGEAEFLRAYCYFYLVNLFGDIPLITKTDVQSSLDADRTPAADVYQQIITDLSDAITKLPGNYAASSGSKTRANKWVAAALLARVYLYKKDWINAETQASSVINCGQYSLLDEPNGVFDADNNEAILQWARYDGEVNFLPSYFIYNVNPDLICSDFLLNAFEDGDHRKTAWIQSSEYSGRNIYIPFKFTTTSTNTTERYTVLRLAEQYLIRAEARAMQDKISDAVSDINLIRKKHGGLPDLSANLSSDECMKAILHERQVELFNEEMHRWFDLKRMNKINEVMSEEKPTTWRSTAALYPIPLTEIQKDSRLVQNPGY